MQEECLPVGWAELMSLKPEARAKGMRFGVRNAVSLSLRFGLRSRGLFAVRPEAARSKFTSEFLHKRCTNDPGNTHQQRIQVDQCRQVF
jgi:hypothetical protein